MGDAQEKGIGMTSVSPRFARCWIGLPISALIFAALLLAANVSATAAEFDVDLRALQAQLRAGDFDGLERKFAELERIYESGGVPDLILERGYEAFGVSDPGMEPLLDRWAAAKPESHRPQLALGNYFHNLGWTFRGQRYARETSDEQISLMRQNFLRAEEHLLQALQHRPRSGVAYGKLINMAMVRGQDDAIDRYLRDGLTADPRSFAIRRNYFGALLPWWGGRRRNPTLLGALRPLPEAAQQAPQKHYPVDLPAAMREFARHMTRDATEFPELEILQGHVEYLTGEMLSRGGQKDRATQYYQSATEFGDYWFFHYQLGRNLHELERYQEALASYDRALELWPDNVSVLRRRARTYTTLDQKDKALADLELAAAIDPYDPDILAELSRALGTAGRADEALAAAEKAFVYGEHEVGVWNARGSAYLYGLKDPAKALPYIERTMEMYPTWPAYRYNYANALYQLRDCRAVEAFKLYLLLCPRFGNNCSDGNKRFAREVLDYMDHPAHCG